MSDGKQLKFTFTVDEASLQKARSVIRSLTSDLTKLNDAARAVGGLGGLGGVNVFGGGASATQQQQQLIARAPPAAQPIVQSVVGQSNSLTGVAKSAGKALEDMGRSAKSTARSVIDSYREATKAVREFDQAQESARVRMGEMGSFSFGGGGHIGGYRSPGYAGADSESGARHVPSGPLLPEISHTSSFRDRLRQSWESMGGLQGLRSFAGAAAIGMQAGGVVSDAFYSTVGKDQAFQGQRNQTWSPVIQAGLGRDLSYGLAMNRALTRSSGNLTTLAGGLSTGLDNTWWKQSLMGIATGGVATSLSGIVNGASTIGDIPGAIISAAGRGGGGSPGGPFGGLTPTGYNNKQMGRVAEAIAMEQAAQDPLFRAGLGHFTGSLNDRIRAQQILGLGGLGEYIGRYPVATGEGVAQNPYDDLNQRLRRKGLLGGAPALTAVGTSLRGMGLGTGWAETVLQADTAGYGGMGNLIASASRTGDPRANAAFASLGGGINPAAGMLLGQHVLGTGFNPNGTTGGMGVLGAAQAGWSFSGGITDKNIADTVGMGLGFGNAFTQGGLDARKRAENLVRAINSTRGRGLGIHAQDYLANGMEFGQQLDIARGGAALTPQAQSLGITRDMVAAQLTGSVSDYLSRWRDDGSNSSMAQRIRAVKASGGDISRYMAGLSKDARGNARRDLATFYSQESGRSFAEAEGVIGLLGDMSPVSPKRGGIGVKAPTDAEGRELNNALAAEKQMTDKLKENFKEVELASDSATRNMADVATLTGNLDTTVKSLVENLQLLNAALRRANGLN